MKLSLKYKFLLVLLGVPSLALYLYLEVAKDLFQKDKVSYVMNSLEVTSSNLSELINLQLKKIDLTTYNFNDFQKNFADRFNTPAYDFLIGMYQVDPQNPTYFEYSAKITEENTPLINNAAKNLLKTEGQGPGLEMLDQTYAFYLPQNWDHKYAFLIDLTKVLNTGKKDSHYDVKIFTKGDVLKKQLSVYILDQKVLEQKIHDLNNSSLSTIGFSTKDHYISLSKSNVGAVVMASLTHSKAMQVLSELESRSFYYFLMFIGVTGLLSIFVTQKLTVSLRALSAATQQVTQGDYDIQLNITSRDEVGDLASAFSQMSRKISELLEELRRYNEKLELIVMERTLKLRQALSLQNAMVESLREGFFLFDESAKISEVYSESTNELFGQDVLNQGVAKVLGIQEETEDFQEFCKVIFQNLLPFKDAIDLLPTNMTTAEGRYLEFKYGHIKVSDGENLIDQEETKTEPDSIYRVVCVVSDKTEELKFKNLLAQEKDFAKTVVELSKSTEAYEALVEGLFNLLERLNNNEERKKHIAEIYREAHTYKAHCMYVGLTQLAESIHDLENELSLHRDDPNLSTTALNEKTHHLAKHLNDTVSRYSSITGVAIDSIESFKKVQKNSIIEFIKRLQTSDLTLTLEHKLLSPILFVNLKTILSKYRGEVDQLSERKQMDAIDYEIKGEDIFLYYPHYKNWINSLIHLIRNSVDHSAEVGKKLSLAFELHQSDNLVITYSDDGKGINKEKVLEKALKYDPNVTKENIDYLYWLSADFFSTADGVSMTSGRGVGLSSVVMEVKNIGGESKLLDRLGFVLQMTIPLPKVEEQIHHVYEDYKLLN